MKKRITILIIMLILVSMLFPTAWATENITTYSSDLVTTCFSKSVSYTAKVYNPDTGKSEDTIITNWFSIPEINLTGSTIEKINDEIHDKLYPIITAVVNEVNTYGQPSTCDGISYSWAVNSDIISLVIQMEMAPDGSGGTNYLVYNIKKTDGTLVGDGTVIQASGIDSETEYYEKAKRALGSYIWSRTSCDFFSNQNSVDWFNDRLNKTISNKNIGQATPYLNEDGQLCMIAKVYSLAAADYYWNNLNLVRYELHPNYATEAKVLNLNNLEDILVNHWWENDIQAPLAYRFYSDGTAEEYLVDPATNLVNTNYISRKFTYELNRGHLQLNFSDNSSIELELIQSESDIYKFFEREFVPSHPDAPEQAMYLNQTTRKLNNSDSSPNPFVDIFEQKYYYTPVLWAVENGITNGVDATHFAPNIDCTRAQVVTFLWRAVGSPEPSSGVNPFTDVKSGSFYYKAVLWAVEKGVVNGTSATTFSPNDNCTRGMVATILYRMQGTPDYSIQTNPFVDAIQGKYYYDAVLWAAETGITTGVDETHYEPNRYCTRGQIVTFLYRALG